MKQILIVIVLSLFLFIYFNPKSKTPKEKDSHIMNFMEKANNAYINSHNLEDVGVFHKFATQKVIRELADEIRYEEKKLFGTERYRNVKFEVIEKTSNTYTVKCSVSHKNIKLHKGINIAIGDNITTIWKIQRSSNSFTVVDII